MKITDNDYSTMKHIINSKLSILELRNYKKEYDNAGLSHTRFIWDIWNYTQNNDYSFTCDTLYKYLNDDNISTALSHAIKELSAR